MKAPRLALLLRLIVATATIGGAAVAFTDVAFAQAGKPKLTVKLSSAKVEVGEPFTYELRITTEGGDPEVTQISLPPGISKVGESAMQGGGQTRQTIVTWQLMAVKAGRYSIPGPPIAFGRQRVVPGALSLEATPSTGRRPNQLQLPGGFSIRIGGGDDDNDAPTASEKAELALATAPDNLIFLRAVANKKTAVIGEQVTVTFYAYFRANFHPEESHDAPFDAFRTRSILEDRDTLQGPLYARAGQDRFNVKVLQRIAAFPLKTGVLHTGTAKMKLSGFRMGGLTDRESNDELITVTEPPIEFRPPGYRFGDVGQFTIEAQVQARRIDEGGAVPVLITVRGSGSFPDSVRVPDRTGLEWLEPEKREDLQVHDGTITGWRSFGYVARVKDVGSVDLGAVSLSFWNPAARRYEVTRAELGKIEVTRHGPAPSSSATPIAPVDATAVDPFVGLSTPRAALGSYVAVRPPFWGDGGLLWALLAAPPLLVAAAFAGSLGLRNARARRAASADSKRALSEKALAEAAEAEARGDTKALAAALERAIHLAVEDATGLKSRGVLMADLPRELEALDVAPELAAAIHAALVACESIRFDPDGASAHDLGEQARHVVRELGHLEAAAT
ncbi:MAG: BatD family protein [Byssovorax sp.]